MGLLQNDASDDRRPVEPAQLASEAGPSFSYDDLRWPTSRFSVSCFRTTKGSGFCGQGCPQSVARLEPRRGRGLLRSAGPNGCRLAPYRFLLRVRPVPGDDPRHNALAASGSGTGRPTCFFCGARGGRVASKRGRREADHDRDRHRLRCGRSDARGGAGGGEPRAETPADTLVMAKNIDDIISLDPAEAFELTGGEVIGQHLRPHQRYEAEDIDAGTGGVAESYSARRRQDHHLQDPPRPDLPLRQSADRRRRGLFAAAGDQARQDAGLHLHPVRLDAGERRPRW